MNALPDTDAFTLPDGWRVPFDLGFSVFPIEPRGKRPLGLWKAYQSARPSLETVRQWASRQSNIGIVTGAVSGLIVLDLDSAAAMQEAEAKGLPDTISASTGKGLHVYFRHPGGIIGNRAGIFPGADIRGDGGYVVAPGSVHASGTEYRWVNPPGLFDLADIPDWLAEMLATPAATRPKPESEITGTSA
jgi:putative DNA primase/helicase